jgi:deazaflavin-dependent oxidoreductase (nitroreductase family)
MSDFNEQMIAEFRANGGHVQTAGFGDNLVLLHTRGAKSGAEQVAPVMGFVDEDSWLVVASKAGAPEHPAWYHNLRAEPRVSIEIPAEGGTATVDVTASELDSEARQAAWANIVAAAPGFADYEAKAAGRVIPVLRLTRR